MHSACMKAIYQPRSGFRDNNSPPHEVDILSFVETEISPGYLPQSHGNKRCLVAVVAYENGRLGTVELCDLKIIR